MSTNKRIGTDFDIFLQWNTYYSTTKRNKLCLHEATQTKLKEAGNKKN